MAPARMRSEREQYPVNGRTHPETQPTPTSAVGPPALAPPLRLIRFPAVQDRTGLSRVTIWRLERNGDFPRHRQISRNAVAWVEEEVTLWIRSKIGDVAV
jgi:prophage regulatory protein